MNSRINDVSRMSFSPGVKPPVLRADIQSLRAVAVILVVMFHANVGGLAAGYLGVDIFFVISGYLITGLLARSIDEERFSFGDFYLSRAKRLLPAAYAVYLATAIASLWILSDAEFDRYLRTLWGALTFASNVVLWQSLGYFAVEAKANPLLHTWSLSLEEQFYFFLPLAMWLVPRRRWLALAVAVFAGSLVLCFHMVPRSPAASFYLLPTRAWELALGATLVLSEPRLGPTLRMLAKRLAWPSLAVLFTVPWGAPGAMLGSIHPGLDALLVCFATALLLLGRASALEKGRVAHAAAWVGGLSYSLYLVHWPLFAFATNAYLGQLPPLTVRLGLVVLSFGLAYLLKRWVEDLVHRRPLPRLRWRGAWFAVVATLIVGGTAMLMRDARVAPRDYAELLRPNYGLHMACSQEGAFVVKPECQTDNNPRTLVWGDSFAMHLVPGLLASGVSGITQASLSSCAPALGIAQYDLQASLGEQWSRQCIEFNRSVLQHLERSPEIDTVVLSSMYTQILGSVPAGFRNEGGRLAEIELNQEVGIEALIATAQAVRGMGKRVIFVGPTPTNGVDIPQCLARREAGLLLFGPASDCELLKDEAVKYRHLAVSALVQLDREPGIIVINLIDRMCPSDKCMVELDGTWLYRDAGHLSNEGSRLLGERKILSIDPDVAP